MSYLNNSHSLNYSSQFADSVDNQVQLLKVNLVQTHAKYIKQLKNKQQVQFQLAKYQQQTNYLKKQNQDLRRKLQHHLHQRVNHDKIKNIQNALVDSQKKNDLLRNDLELMRSKTMQIVTKNQQLQNQIQQYQQTQHKIHNKINSLTNQLKQKQQIVEQQLQNVQRYRAKYQKQVMNNQQAEQQLEDLKRQKVDLQRQYEHLQQNFLQQKQKLNKHFHEILMLQKDNKEWKSKVQQLYEQNTQLKNQLYQIKSKVKNEEKNLTGQLQKLTFDYNNLQTVLKQKQFQIQSARKRPIQQHSKRKRKHTFEQTKQLINKLERQEQIINRSSPTRQKLSHSPMVKTRTYKQQKQQYLSIIESVGSMENQMLTHNMQKKRIIAQIDKIDQTRVKTKDMISRRRRLEVQLQNQEKNIQRIKSQLKKMKVM